MGLKVKYFTFNNFRTQSLPVTVCLWKYCQHIEDIYSNKTSKLGALCWKCTCPFKHRKKKNIYGNGIAQKTITDIRGTVGFI